MHAERKAEEQDRIRLRKGESFSIDAKLNLLCVYRVSAVSFRLPLRHRDSLAVIDPLCPLNGNGLDFGPYT